MHKLHKGICGAHELSPKMKWLIHRYGYYWPTIAANYTTQLDVRLAKCMGLGHGFNWQDSSSII